MRSRPPRQFRLDRLHVAPWNPRTIKDERFQNLVRSIQADPDFLWRRPILATADGTIYAGNMRYRAAGAGVGMRFLNHVCERYFRGENRYGRPGPMLFHTSHPGLCAALRRDSKWVKKSARLFGANKLRSARSLTRAARKRGGTEIASAVGFARFRGSSTLAPVRGKPDGRQAPEAAGRACLPARWPREAACASSPRPPPPRSPDGLADHAVAVWTAFWASRVSGAVDLDADGEALRHWMLCIDEREKLRAATVRAPLVKGSHEQLMLNPLFRRLRDLNREIARAEEHFGMTPLARLRLGVTFLQEQAAKDDLQARRERRQPHPM